MAANKILVIAPDKAGHSILMQPMLACLKQREPECRLDILAPARNHQLLQAIPEVNRLIAAPGSKQQATLAQHYQLAQQLRTQRYQQAIIIPDTINAAWIPLLAGIPKRTGFLGRLRIGLINDRRRSKQKNPRLVELFAQLAENNKHDYSPPSATPKLPLKDNPQLLSTLGLDAKPGIIAFCFGIETHTPRWPSAFWRSWRKNYSASNTPSG